MRVTARKAWAGGAFAVFLSACAPPRAPPDSIARTPTYQDPAHLRTAWALPVARLYARGGYVYQSNPSTCGPTSIADVLRSQDRAATPEQVLRGSGVRTIFGVLPGGLTLDQEAALLRLRAGRPVSVLRNLSLEAFRAEVAHSNDTDRRYIVNFTRQPLFGRGHGHFSPVLGYLAREDLVFVGDVNDGYRPWLVPTARLYAAQAAVDPSSHAPRGLLRIMAAPRPARS